MSCTQRSVLGSISMLAAIVSLAAPTAFGASVIVDNMDAGFSVLSGTWSTTSATGQWGTNYRYKSTSSSVTGEVEWRPNLPEAGDYIVSVWYRSTGSSRPNNARYTVHYSGGTADVYVNQQINGSVWVELGTYSFAAGTTGRVTLVDQAQTSKTIVADAVQFESSEPPGPEFRAFWADVFHYGLQDATQIDEMISMAVAGNYNAIIPEVLAYHDDVSGSHGAYWESDIVARSPFVTGGFDPLAYMVQQAHANGLEIHPWMVAYRTCSAWPPSGNDTLAAHPEWLMVPSGSIGTIAPVGSVYTLDPGAAGAQEYLISIVKELVTNYEIDGIHWDYIRYTQTDAGYPADLSYPKSGLARFQEIYNRADVPSTGDSQWNDFRRRTITELIRRCQVEVQAIASNPRQPLRHSASLIAWGDAPANFEDARAYYEVFQNWREWMERGYLDTGIPMNYDREYNTDQAQWFRNWVDAEIVWSYDRQLVAGPGIYMNTMADSITQILYARNAGADGISTYSYWSTTDSNMDGTTEHDPAWYPYVAANAFTTVVPIPAMAWRDPATATEGTLYGQVTDASTGDPVDDATVQVGALGTVQTDGNGYYVVTLIPATAGGTAYDVTASKSGLPTEIHLGVQVFAGDVRREDLVLGELPCVAADYDCDGDVDLTDFGAFSACFNGPNRAPATDGCAVLDFDSDSDVDLTDFGVFSGCFNGPNRAPACP